MFSKLALGFALLASASAIASNSPVRVFTCVDPTTVQPREHGDPGSDEGFKAIFYKKSKNSKQMYVRVSEPSFDGPQFIANLPCSVGQREQTPSGDLNTTWLCDDESAEHVVTLFSTGLQGKIIATYWSPGRNPRLMNCHRE